ncbi:unnamed protein product [Rotaria magnacalcarata]|uniref:Uncharacterized protein n=4 Tax=Rotaria magnacalcarata TaxID=392030 RepID=A0A816L378_9BILA|nr:unnamed protein product [Rotaria magnacalcarata]
MNTNADQLTHSIITTTTQMKIMRRIEVTPTAETISRFQSTHNQSFTGYPRLWTNQSSIPIALNSNRRSLKILWFTACLFISVGLIAVSVAIIGLIIAFRQDIDNVNANYIEILPIHNHNPKLMYSTIKSSSSSLKTKKTISTAKISPTSSTPQFHKLIETTNSVSYFKSSIISTIDYLSTITQFDTSQMQETSTVFLNEVQTPNYIEETTELPAYISTSIKQETINDHQLLLSTESSITTEIYFPKTLPSMFQFLPFRPSTNTSTRFTRRHYNNSFIIIKTNATQQTPLTQQRNRFRQKHIKYLK